MKISHFTLFLLLSTAATIQAQHTFSIVALDTLTGEIGSAGASCLDENTFPGSGGAIVISDILPGRGAIHTQAFWLAANQANARMKMEEGLAPADILLWLKQNDPEGLFGAQKRQYGIVDFDPEGHPRSAAFTGNSCYEWKGHRTGANYSIQGNILLGAEVVDSIEARFLSAQGSLADKLMAALQGANVIGADTRCTDNGTSSLSAFLRVAQPGDADDLLWLDLNVPSLPATMEPIDSLQHLYDEWKALAVVQPLEARARVFPNPAQGQLVVQFEGTEGRIEWFNLLGRQVVEQNLNPGENHLSPTLPDGIYFLKISTGRRTVLVHKLFWQP